MDWKVFKSKILRRKEEYYHLDMQQRVLAGAQFLDNSVQAPSNWRERINVEDLNVMSPENCILGQLFEGNSRHSSGYEYALCNVLPFDANPNRLGFCGGNELTMAWVDYLKNYKPVEDTIPA